MTQSPVARVYTQALFDIAKSQSVVEETGSELEQVQAMLERDAQFLQFFNSPVLETTTKVEILRRSLQGKVSDTVIDFLCLLLEKDRFTALPSITMAYREMADAHAGRARVRVATAMPMEEGLRREIAGAIARGIDREVILEDEVEPALVGGAVITIGDKVYDGSLATRLNQYRRQIMRRAGYED
jgi:F-type H+-transporting ATPase subunit delta